MSKRITPEEFLKANFPEEEGLRTYIRSIYHEEEYKKHDIIVKHGEMCNKSYFLEQGAVMHRYVEGEIEKATLFTFEGEPFTAWESFESETPSEYYIQCIEDCKIGYFTKEDFDNIPPEVADINRVRYEYTIGLFLNHHNLMAKLIAYSTEKLYDYITTEHPNIIQRVPLKYIAEFMGISNEHLSRLRRKLMKR